jgi:hypothetical protein
LTAESIIYLLIGLFSGFMSGLFGIGGGSIRIPLLNLAGLPLLNAFAINLLIIPLSSSIGAASQRRNINKKVAVYMIIGGTLGSITGALLAGLISMLGLAVCFVAVSVVTVIGIYLDRIAPALARKISPGPRSIIAGSLALSLIVGMRGGSGGCLFPPFLRAMKLDIHKAIATSLFVTIFTAMAGVVIYWRRGDIVWLPAMFMLIGSMIGVGIGSRASLKAKPTWLETGLTILVIALASITIYKAL